MSTVARLYTFTDGTTAFGSQVETELSTIFNAWNNHDSGSSTWTVMKAAAGQITTSLTMLSSAVVLNTDGTGAIPSYSYSGDTDTGFFRQGSGINSIASNGFEGYRFGLTSATDATSRSLLTMYYGGGSGNTVILSQTTTGVTNAGSYILTGGTDAIGIVNGNDGAGNNFSDFIAYSYNGTVTKVNSGTASGAPQVRTYTSDATGLKLAMAANTYAVNAFVISLSRR